MDGPVKFDDSRSAASHSAEFGFLPPTLSAQCQALIESFHEIHGYASLPDALWKAGFGPFIEAHNELRDLFRKAATTRSAKKSNTDFVRIATTILSLEILAGHFAAWSANYPDAARQAEAILKQHGHSAQTPLTDFYLHPPNT